MAKRKRPQLRKPLRSGDRRLQVYFHTSNVEKFLHASVVCDRSGLNLRHFKSTTDPYHEDYTVGKNRLLTRAIAEILEVVGKTSLFFVEDTSLRVEALSTPECDFPGLAVKEWFSEMSFSELDAMLRKKGNDRRSEVKSDIALHVPKLTRPVFFSGSTVGRVADSAPNFESNTQYPWLTPNTFNGWFIPDGATKPLGAMTLDESWEHDFRTEAIEEMVDRLEEYAAIINLPNSAYARVRPIAKSDDQLQLFEPQRRVFCVIGKTCAGKSTFGERSQQLHRLTWVEASSVLRTFHNEYEGTPTSGFELAKKTLTEKGSDAIARRTLDMFGDCVDDGLVISGFRTIEELETISSSIPDALVVLIEASERRRYERHLARGGRQASKGIKEFRQLDRDQCTFGLLRVAEEFADIKIANENTLDDYLQQVDSLFLGITASIPGVTVNSRARSDLDSNQIFHCLRILNEAGLPLSCDEIEERSINQNHRIRHNNANKVLKTVPELARRLEIEGSRLRYQITDAGRAYLRFSRSRSKGGR